MKKCLYTIIVATATLLTLTACGSSSNDKSYYQLTSCPKTVSKTSLTRSNHHLLWIKQVMVSNYLAGQGIVYQTSEVKYVIASNNLWASPLDQQLCNTLVDNLSNYLPGWIITTSPLSRNQDTLIVSITGFHGRYDGKVVVNGEWLLLHQKKLIKHSFHLELKQYQDGYNNMVKTLSRAWDQEAQQLSREIGYLS